MNENPFQNKEELLDLQAEVGYEKAKEILDNRSNPFKQVCVWPGTIVGPDPETIQDMEEWFLELGFRIKYIEEIKTKPTPGEYGTGGRNDCLFYIHSEDVAKFSVPRFQFGVRWIEDVLDNEPEEYSIYPEHMKKYRTWSW